MRYAFFSIPVNESTSLNGGGKKKVNILCIWSECSPKGGLAEEDLNNQVAKEHILWIPVSPSTATADIIQGA